jgi:nicotinate-nucleotide pyrophosphorylase
MFQMFQSMASQEDKAEAKEMQEMIDQLNGLKIVVLKTDSTTPAKAASFYSEAVALFPSATYKEIMTVNESGNDIKFLTKQASPGKISEMVMLMRGKTETIVMSLTGNIDLATVSKLSKTVNVPGMDKLKEVNDKK